MFNSFPIKEDEILLYFHRFMNMRMVTATVFYRIQKLYCAPVIETYWNSILDHNISLFKNKSTVCAGGKFTFNSAEQYRYSVFLRKKFFSGMRMFRSIEK